MSQIEASHYSEDPIAEWATFKALEGHRSVDQHISDFLNVDDQLQDIQTHAWMLDHESDDIPGKLEQYLKLMAPIFYERELSPFVRTTLAVASSLAAEKEDVQLSRVLDLWAVNHVLVDIEMRWRTFEKTEDGERNSIDEETDEQSYQLICSQLRAAAEKRASHLSKGVMNDLERRLLQRTQGGWFETYLVAILLLNCVERGSWLFRTWAPEQFRSKVCEPMSHTGHLRTVLTLGSGLLTDLHRTTMNRESILPTCYRCCSRCGTYPQRCTTAMMMELFESTFRVYICRVCKICNPFLW